MLKNFEGKHLPSHAQMTWGKSPAPDRLQGLCDLPVLFKHLRTPESAVPTKMFEMVSFIGYIIEVDFSSSLCFANCMFTLCFQSFSIFLCSFFVVALDTHTHKQTNLTGFVYILFNASKDC